MLMSETTKENNMKTLIKKLNDAKILQKQISWEENIPDDLWKELNGKYQEVASNLMVDTHRHYELSTTVIKIESTFIGIEHITNIFSESSCCEDCYHTLRFFEMEEVQTTTYKQKEDKS